MRAPALALAAAVLVFPLSALAQSIEIGPGGVRFGDGRGRGPDCEELRSACLNKDRLGEQGEGNCRRYRNLCRSGARRSAYGAGDFRDGGRSCRVITQERENAYGEIVVRRTRVCD